MRPLHKKVSCYCGVVEWDALLRGIAFTLFLLIGSLLSITTNFLRVMVVGPGSTSPLYFYINTHAFFSAWLC